MSLEQLVSRVAIYDNNRPKYEVIAEELKMAIRNGQMPMGEKLPAQRHLAQRLGVTAATVSRAYGSLERQGLATARVGDGTYVSATDPAALDESSTSPPLDLAHNVAITTDEVECLANALTHLSSNPDKLREMLSYQPEVGLRRHREAGAKWLLRFGTQGEWSRVMVTHGAQHGLACVLKKLARPGDAILTESLSYPGLIAQARLMRLQLIGVETDEQGMLPDDLERMAKTMSAKIMFCSPSLHNPTSSTMSVARRMDIAAVAQRCGLLVIEDCVHAAAQLNPLPALSTWLPNQSFLLSSFSKVVSPGLRVGFLEASPEWLGQIAGIMRADCWMVAPLLPEIATDWLASGMMDELIARQRRHIGERVNLAQHIFEGLNYQSHPEYPHVWVSLPDPWRAGQFSAALRNAGVQVRTSDHFAVGRTPAPHAVRVSLNASADFDQLEEGLHIFKTVAHKLP